MNDRRSAVLACAMLGALALSALAGCAPKDSRTIVRMWAMGREGEVVQQMLPAFERENPGVHVIVQQVPWSAAHEKLITSSASPRPT